MRITNRKGRFQTCPYLRWGLFVLLLLPGPTLAGHGFLTAFGNIEWLPEPGRTPDSATYKLDAVQEEAKVLLARDPAAKLQLYLAFTREKLAELEAMVKGENAQAAQTAVERYRVYLDRARTLVAEQNEAGQKEALAETAATALLEHQYILSVIYPDLTSVPKVSRQILLTTATMIGERYKEIAALMPAKKKGALFFKEEEVRWSLQMAERADEETGEALGEKELDSR